MIARNGQLGYKGSMAESEAGILGKLHRFTKLEHTVFSLPLLFSGAWIGAGGAWPSRTTLGLLVAAGVGARVLGMAMNRILDRHIDAKNPRTRNRELPAGTISLTAAWTTAAAGLAVYEIACFLLGPLIALLSPIPAVVLIGYSLLKRFTPLCHFGIGLAMGLAPAGAYTAVTLSLQPTWDILAIFVFAFFWISGFDIIYALLDETSDRVNGVHSLPVTLGANGAQWAAAVTHLAAFAALIALVWGGTYRIPGYLCLAVSAGGFIAAHISRIPVAVRFFPISAVAGIAGALIPFFKS